MKYVLPVPGGKKEFCSEPCLTSYRKAQKALSIQNSAPNPYSLPLTAANSGGAAAARSFPANGKPAAVIEPVGGTSSPVKSSVVKIETVKIESVTPCSSSSSNNAPESAGSESDHQQSPGNSKKSTQPTDQEVSVFVVPNIRGVN